MCGLSIAWLDSRPGWDDSGITAGLLLLTAAALGAAGPRRPWRWALGVGIWIPALASVRAPGPGSLAMLLVLGFPLTGAFAGAFARRIVRRA